MGAFKLFSSSSFDRLSNQNSPSWTKILDVIQKSGNPNPSNYKINRTKQVKNFLLIEINYPDSTNYEGNKILLFKDCNLEDLKLQDKIDPHFSENKLFYSPIARFEPTEFGWNMGLDIIKNYTK
jgi:hypothetical protein